MQFWELKKKKITNIRWCSNSRPEQSLEWEDVNLLWQCHFYLAHDSMTLTNAPSSLKIAEEPMWSDGTIFRLQRRRRNVSEERSFLWNFQPIRDEYSQPSPGSRLCRNHCRNQPEFVSEKSWFQIFLFLTSTAAVWSDIFFLGLTSLILRWTWYIFSAATQDLGLSSGGMVIPYSQPVVQRKRSRETVQTCK